MRHPISSYPHSSLSAFVPNECRNKRKKLIKTSIAKRWFSGKRSNLSEIKLKKKTQGNFHIK